MPRAAPKTTGHAFSSWSMLPDLASQSTCGTGATRQNRTEMGVAIGQ
jgi:hypothetical protein